MKSQSQAIVSKPLNICKIRPNRTLTQDEATVHCHPREPRSTYLRELFLPGGDLGGNCTRYVGNVWPSDDRRPIVAGSGALHGRSRW